MPEPVTPPESVTIFIAYSRKDLEDKDHVEVCLKSIQHSSPALSFKFVSDSDISAGDHWPQALATFVENAAVILLLVSRDFFASSWCIAEMERALEAQSRHGTRVIPVIIRDAHGFDKSPLRTLQTIPGNAKARQDAHWRNADQFWKAVESELQKVIRGLTSAQFSAASEEARATLPPAPARVSRPAPGRTHRSDANRVSAPKSETASMLPEGDASVIGVLNTLLKKFSRASWPLRAAMAIGLMAIASMYGYIHRDNDPPQPSPKSPNEKYIITPLGDVNASSEHQDALEWKWQKDDLLVTAPKADGLWLDLLIRQADRQTGKVSLQPARGKRVDPAKPQFVLPKPKWDDQHYIEIGVGKRHVHSILPVKQDRPRETVCAGRNREPHLAWLTIASGVYAFFHGHSAKGGRIDLSQCPDAGEADAARNCVDADPNDKPAVAIVGSYHSAATRAIQAACENAGQDIAKWQRSRCGPILTLSSSEFLRNGLPQNESTWLFRVMPSNRQRAKTLASVLRTREFREVAPLNKLELQIVYEHDPYAMDQAQELKRALECSAKNTAEPPRACSDYNIKTTWYSYQRSREPSGNVIFAEHEPDLEEEVLTRTSQALQGETLDSFAKLPERLERTSDKTKLVVLITLDENIYHFGQSMHALATQWKQPKRQFSIARWYAIGPSELFEHDWAKCFYNHPYLDQFEAVRVVTPNFDAPTEPEYIDRAEFAKAWEAILPGEVRAKKSQNPASRALVAFKSFDILNQSIVSLENELFQRGISRMRVDLYRYWLRDELAKRFTNGDSGDKPLIKWVQHGELQNYPY